MSTGGSSNLSDFDLSTIEPRIVDSYDGPPVRPSVSDHATPSKAKRVIVAVIAVAAGVAAAVATSEPTGSVADVGWRVVIAVLATFAASTARRWSLIWMAALSVVLCGSWIGLAAAAAALALAAWSALMPRHNRIVGALVGALSVQAMLRPPDVELRFLYGITVIIAIVPVCFSAYRLLRRRRRRRVRRGVVLATVAVVLLSGAAVVAAVMARADMNDGVDAMRSGLAAIDEGDDDAAAADFTRANRLFTTAQDSLAAPWAVAAGAVPVVAQHVDAADAVASSGASLSSTAAAVASGADYRDLRLASGAVDLELVTRIGPTVDLAAVALTDAKVAMDTVDDEWLLPPLDDAVQTLQREIDDVQPEAQLASEALEVLPAILGGDAPRRYLVAVTSPNETRNSGGFLGGYAEIVADAGTLTKVRAGSVSELNRGAELGPRTLEDSPEFAERYSTYVPARFLQNATASPDLPTTADVLAELYPNSGGAPLDGVVYIDPVGLAALLELTGPIEVEGIDRPITAENVEAFLLKRQYVEFPNNPDRDEVQANVASATFDALLSTELPGPRRLGEVLGPVVHQGHIGFWTFTPDEQTFLRSVDADGAFEPGDGDFLSVRVANAAPNKLDAYLERTVDYDVEVDPDTGAYTGTATVTLRNAAPDGLDAYVAGNRDLLDGRPDAPPLGTNRLFVTTYSNSTVLGATLDGEPVPLGVQDELGTRAHIALVDIPRGETVTLVYDVEGVITDGEYRLRLSHPPLAKPDRVTLTVRTTDGDELALPPGATDVSERERDIVVPVPGG